MRYFTILQQTFQQADHDNNMNIITGYINITFINKYSTTTIGR